MVQRWRSPRRYFMPKRRKAARGITFDAVVDSMRALPGVERGTSYGTPALKVGGKLLARLWEDEATLVVAAPFVVRDHLMQSAPEVFYLTDHYRDYPWVLVRLARVDGTQLREFIEDAWRRVAPKRSVAAYDNGRKLDKTTAH